MQTAHSVNSPQQFNNDIYVTAYVRRSTTPLQALVLVLAVFWSHPVAVVPFEQPASAETGQLANKNKQN
jgi:hypothetical protein